MQHVAHPERIVDPAALDAVLSAAIGERGARSPQQALVAELKPVLQAGRREIETRFMASQDGAMAMAGTSWLIDTIVRALHRITAQTLFRVSNPTKGEKLAICAVGGYGRAELAPQSDIDLLFLLPYKATPHTEQVIEFLLYVLWDLGLKVGHATRSVDDSLRQATGDITIRTALLEARLISGDEDLFADLEKRFEREVIEGSGIGFVDAKLAERDQRHQRLGDSRYVLEPNIKEGKGGLRDLHGLLWIAKYLFRVRGLDELVERGILSRDEASRFHRAEIFLWTVRCHLHYLTGRPEERLTFDVQAEIGRRMGYTDHAGSRGVERFMKHYFLIAKDVGDLTRIFIAALEAEQKRKPVSLWRRLIPGTKSIEGFKIDGGRLSLVSDRAFEDDPVNLLRLFHVAETHRLDIHPHAIRLVTQSLKLIDGKLRADPEANRLFMEILTSRIDPENSLRRLNEAGVFGRFIPDFGRVVAQMQYDMYHVYTVDEHTIFALAQLHKIEAGELKDELPLASSIVDTIASRRALYLAVLLHDIAKGRPGDHSELGAKIALKLGPRLGLDAEETETVSWLVLHHLVMSRTAFKRDIDDPKTIQDFVARVQSPERLKLLLILTACDIRAVGPNVWNGWKAALLRELYRRAQELMSGGVVADPRDVRIAKVQEQVRELLPEFDAADFAAFTQRGYPFYWLSHDPVTLARHARLMREADRNQAPLTVANRVDLSRSVTEVTVYTADHPGLFSRIAGALSLAGAMIVDARIVTMVNGMALDTFWVQDAQGDAFDRPDKLARLAVLFENVLGGKLDPRKELKRRPALPSRTRVFTVAPRVLIDNKASAAHTVVEVNGRDRPALLFDLTRALTAQGVQISGAKITTYGEKVVDVFYVKDIFGLKIEHESKIRDIREALVRVLTEGDGEPAAKPAAAKAKVTA
ncbi:bifunctional uridylyltransferase/uridylyl-removing enzyme [Aliidongia dinghuensis]|uniref:Bifunctional uridylyltransferase/uridylyl-removing enzyme n=1 Tax=Aliidongia dinghuensis TaxID=1867774 RepID=A0A8J2YYG9_9PROT|nr:[protein-PII] uridylyltransferase [Aliidongia dinghuensis]GGF33089.1 bifunctional uridylyltransferase/uridylyl-removing enzyme [Aliidongia dinghuensis]